MKIRPHDPLAVFRQYLRPMTNRERIMLAVLLQLQRDDEEAKAIERQK